MESPLGLKFLGEVRQTKPNNFKDRYFLYLVLAPRGEAEHVPLRKKQETLENIEAKLVWGGFERKNTGNVVHPSRCFENKKYKKFVVSRVSS